MAPSFCAIPGCSTRYKKGSNTYIVTVKNLKFLAKDTDEYIHHENLRKVILSFRNPQSKSDGILSQLHRENCGICERHFKEEDFVPSGTGSTRKKRLKLMVMPTENMPTKSISSEPIKSRRPLIREPLPQKIVHKNFEDLKKKIKHNLLMQRETEWTFNLQNDVVTCRFFTTVSSKFQLDILPSLKCKLYYFGLPCCNDTINLKINLKVTTLAAALHQIENLQICSGISATEEIPSINAKKHIIPVRNENELSYFEVHRAPNCSVIVENSSNAEVDRNECHSCQALSKKCAISLQRKRRYMVKKESVALEKFSKGATQQRVLFTARQYQMKLKVIKEKLKALKQHVTVDESVANDIHSLMENNSNYFYRLFYTEQLKMQKLKGSSCRFHPDVIRFALSLCLKSPSCYEELRSSGLLVLPSKRTLMDYRNAHRPSVGWTDETHSFIEKYSRECSDRERLVFLILDEMNVRQSLVYDRKTGEMIGFTDLGQRWNNKPNNLATHALQVYVKSVCGTPGLKYPLSYFACDSVKAPQLVSIVWESVGLLERKKLKVVAVVADGLSANRNMFKLMSGEKSIQATNLWAPERKIYLIPDPPHLIKTTRNCILGSRGSGNGQRLIHRNGKHILWDHFLYLESLNDEFFCNRLSKRHVHPTSFSKMNVKLAAQTLSAKVAHSMKTLPDATKRAEMEETANFVQMMDIWFDTMNTRMGRGKPSIQVFRCADDERLKWLTDVFLPFLEQWRADNLAKFGRGTLEKSFLSRPTYEGLQVATSNMVELVKFLLKEGLTFVATRRISQDTLEGYFGHQRAIGRRCDNPSIYEFGYRRNAIILRRQLHHSSKVSDREPLPKRRRVLNK